MTRDREPFDVAMGELFDDLMTGVHTALPGRVVSFDRTLQTCTVQPTLKRKYKGSDTAELLPVIADVPVIFPGSEDLFLVFDLKPDSYVLLVFSERAIADWMVKGGEVDPQRKRKHSLSDAIAIPGILPAPAVLSAVEADTISMRNKLNTANVKVKTDGNVVINNGTTAVARKNEPTITNATTDSVFITWIAQVSTYINGLVPGTITPVPVTVTGKVNDGSSTVKVP